ncbi:MAG TPA: putative lipid II flippase FtsW [Anaerovoracaceae bacterium]|nr:putative lipid II flippase FtsW [Anaerovoracaceae bacterium]
MGKRLSYQKIKSGDFLIIVLVTALAIFGVVMVFSASYYNAINFNGTPYTYLIRQGIYAVIGFGLMWLCSRVDYHIYGRFAVIILVGSFVLLGLLFTPLGVEVNNATRWLNVGITTLMPGEIAKLAAIIFVSWFLSKDPQRILSFTRGIVPLVLVAGAYGIMIIMQPNLSTAITVCGIIVGIMFLAGLQWRYLIGLGGMGAAAIWALIFIDDDGYRMNRLTSFMDPFADKLGTGYQVVQSLLALGTGGLFGLGLGKSVQKNLYLPEPQNDFILAIIGEELGFIGILVIMSAYAVLIWRCFHISMNAPDKFGMLLAGGVTIMLALQVLINIAVVTSSMPPTGITLPFISYGGNALMLFMASIGIVLNISRKSAV